MASLPEPAAAPAVAAGPALDVLVIAAYDGADAWAIRDFLFSFRAYSRHRYHYVLDPRRLGPEVDLAAFDVVLLFWSASLLGPAVGEALRDRLARCAALKVVFAQDEHQDVALRVARLAELGAGVVCTCAAERDHEAFYPARRLPRLEGRYTVLPGYVPAYLEDHPAWRRAAAGTRRRPLDVGYRSRAPPMWLGDLARHKVLVAERLGAACGDARLRTDLSVRELDRLYGAAWLRFLARSRCVLGSPSGASVVDLDGTIRRDCARHLARDPDAPYAAVRSRYFAQRDGALAIDTVSARVFEAAALGCTLVHVAGAYGGVLEPGRHYLPVAPDYGNLDEVVAGIGDHGYCRELAAHAHRDLVASGRYGYRRFVAGFDAILARHARRRSAGRRPAAAFHLRRAALHGQPFLPVGAGCAVAPLPLPLATAALRRLPLARVPAGPLLRRVVRHPRGFADRLLGLTRLLASEPPARALLRARRLAATPPATWRLLEDLLKLAVAVRARRVSRSAPQPWAVDLELAAEDGVLWLVSRAAAAPAPAAEPDAAALVAARVRKVVWDHARVGCEVTAAVGRRRVATFSLGEGGVYRCAAISSLCRDAGERVVPVLASWLGAPGARRG